MANYEIDWEGNYGSFAYTDSPIDMVRMKAGRLAASTRKKIRIYTWTGGWKGYQNKTVYATVWYSKGDILCRQDGKTYILNEWNGKLKER